MATIQYPREKLWEAYEKLPEEIKDVVFADQTIEQIERMCEKNNISEEEKISKITKCIRNVLFGLLLPSELEITLTKEVKLNSTTSKNLVREIDRLIFSQIKPALEELYNVKITSPDKQIEQSTIKEETPKKPPRKDIYHEPVE